MNQVMNCHHGTIETMTSVSCDLGHLI